MKCFRSMHIRRVLVPVMAVSLLSACGGYGLQQMTLKEAIDKRPTEARLTILDGTQVNLERPQVSGAYVIGQTEKTEYGAEPTVVRLPVDSVAYAAIRGNADAVPEILAVVAAVTIVVAVVIGGINIWHGL